MHNTGSSVPPPRRWTWLLAAGAAIVLLALSGLAASFGDTESQAGKSDARGGWALSKRSIVDEPTVLYEWLFPEFGFELNAVGTPERVFLLSARSDEDDDENEIVYVIEAIDGPGEPAWTRRYPGMVDMWSFDGGLIVYARESLISSAGVLYRLNPASGEPVWEVDVKASPLTFTAFAGRAYMTDGGWLTAVDLETGTVVASAYYDLIGDLDDVRRGGGIAVRDESDVVVLDADLAEVARFAAGGDGRLSYTNGQVLAFDQRLPFNGNTARLYRDDGTEIARLKLEATVDKLAAIDDSSWVFWAGALLDPTCGAVSVTDGELAQLWEHDRCDPMEMEQLDDGITYVMSWNARDSTQGAFYEALTGNQVDIPAGSPAMGSNGFLTSSLDTFTSQARSTTGEVTTFDSASVTMIDGGFILNHFLEDRPVRAVAVYGPGG